MLRRLTHLPYVSPESVNQVQEKHSDLLSKQVFVHMYEIDDDNVIDKLSYRQVNSYPTIFVSKSLFYSLRLKLNSKVKLESVTYENKFKPTQIDFAVVKGEVRRKECCHWKKSTKFK